MKFFKPDDFVLKHADKIAGVAEILAIGMADRANAKLERKGKVIYGQLAVQEHVWNTKNKEWHDTHKALLICIEPIEACKHPGDKIKISTSGPVFAFNEPLKFECECGVKVKPASFEVAE